MHPQVIQATDRLVLDDAGAGRLHATIHSRQLITDDFIQENRELRDIQGKKFRPGRDCVMAARIPTAVVDKWIREGFNILADKNITADMILARLRMEDLDDFITSDMRFSN